MSVNVKALIKKHEQFVNDGIKNSGKRPLGDQSKDDKQLAKAIQESLNADSHNVVKNVAEDDKQLAIALQESLKNANENQYGENRTKEDEELAKAIQESLKTESPPRRCAGCERMIDSGKYVTRLALFWHLECSQCHYCNQATSANDELSKSKKGLSHKACEKASRICYVCNERIPRDASGRISIHKHRFWKQNYCPSHDTDGTATCCGCERMEQKGVEYLKLDDGRKLCLECLESGTMDTNEGQPVYLEVQNFFEGLHMKIEQDFPLYLVERQALNHAREEETRGSRDLAQTRGVCLSEVQRIDTISKGPRTAGEKPQKTTVQLVHNYEVTAILILYGLPRLLTGSILAHELMHAWLRLNGYKKLKRYIEEGICQVLAHMWLESETFASSSSSPASASASSSSHAVKPKKGKQSESEKKLVELFKKQIDEDRSLDYGVGFKLANRAVANFGLEWTLRHIKTHNDFP